MYEARCVNVRVPSGGSFAGERETPRTGGLGLLLSGSFVRLKANATQHQARSTKHYKR